VRAAGAAGRLEQCVDLTGDQAARRLRAIPGIGVWTAAEVRHTALGDPDAVSFGDYHVAKDIGWALTGSEVDDDALAELLEPYAGHRYRVQGLLKLAGAGRPRRGPRMPSRTHLPHRFA
jgi:3-methyladenine DNA glycosylase/8-oxoguanine DNA glycosylase